MPRALLALAFVTALAVPSFAADRPAPKAAAPPTPAVPPDPNLATAREALLVAQEQLRIAGAGKPDVYGGHRKLALELVNTKWTTGCASRRRKPRAASERPSRSRRRNAAADEPLAQRSTSQRSSRIGASFAA
jgi:hypothetical protein